MTRGDATTATGAVRALSRAWAAKRRRALWLVAPLALLAAGIFNPAAAIDVQCIEESKYKYLFKIFGGDVDKFAAYLEIDGTKVALPAPELCRAALVSGGIGDPADYTKLLDFILGNRGWLAAIYLSSPGGRIWTGERLGFLVRNFRLKTYTARNAGNKVIYEPDFGLPPPSVERPETGAADPPKPQAAAKTQAPRCFLKGHVPPAKEVATVISGVVRPETVEASYNENVDRAGQDYRNFVLPMPDAHLCQKSCIGEAKCRAWAYNPPERTAQKRPLCFLKGQVPPTSGVSAVVSGVVVRPGELEATFDEKVDRAGEDYRDFELPLPIPRQCQKACVDDAKCRAWAYVRPDPAYMVSLMAGWDAFREGKRALLSAPAPSSGWCASACTFLHSAGVDRAGVIQVHRGNMGFGEMSNSAEALLEGETQLTFYYRHMDPGPWVIRTYHATSATTVTPVRDTRFPRYAADYLIANCQTDPEQLQNLEAQLATTINELTSRDFGISLRTDHLRAEYVRVHDERRRLEQCVARAHEQDRLAAFDRICGKGCDLKKLTADFDAALRKILQGQ